MASDFHCKVCDIHCSGEAPYKQHVSSAKHIKKASASASPSTPVPSTAIASNRLTADLDDNIIAAPMSYPISPATMRILLEWNHPRGYKPYCDICQVVLYGGNNADTHFAAENNLHNQKLAASSQIRSNAAKNSCKDCSEVFSSEADMEKHFHSDVHETTVQQRKNLEKIIKIFETYEKLKDERRRATERGPVTHDTLTEQLQQMKVGDHTSSNQSAKSSVFNMDRLKQAMTSKHESPD